MNNERRGPSLFGPIVLIGLGLLLLLNNFGVLTLDFWSLLARYWPLLLIAAGLDLLIGRRSGIGALLAVALLALLVVGSLSWGGASWVAADSAQVQTISQGLAGATRAEVHIAAGVSQLNILGSAVGEQLIEGTIVPLTNERIVRDFAKTGATARYTVRSENVGFTLPNWRNYRGEWNLRLNGQTPLALDIDTGVGEANLNLERLQLTGLEIATGIGETTITLPGRGAFVGKISGGVGQVTILIPAGLPVRISATAGIGSVEVTGDFVRDGKAYRSANYTATAEQVELTVSGGIGAIVIRQVVKE